MCVIIRVETRLGPYIKSTHPFQNVRIINVEKNVGSKGGMDESHA